MPKASALILTLLLVLFAACTDGDRMRRELAQLEARNQADSLLTDSVVAQRLADYFDSHGSQAERLEAHYLLARTWADLGQAPRALDAFHTAAEQADTTRLDSLSCHLLSRIYGQMGGLFYQYSLPRNALFAYKQAEKFANYANERSIVFNFVYQQSNCYFLLNIQDSVSYNIKRAYIGCLEAGDTLSANTCLGPLAYDNLVHGNIMQGKKDLDLYQYHSLLNESTIAQIEEWKLLYFYRGFYHLQTNHCDSAIRFFRILAERSTSLNNKGLAYKGLYKTFALLQNADSTQKYATLYAETSDSSNRISTSSALLSMQYLYDYSHFQALASRKTIEAEHANHRLLLLALVIIVFTAITIVLFIRYSARAKLMRQQMIERYTNALLLYNKVKEELQTLNEQNTEQLQAAKSEMERLRDELAKAQNDKRSPDQWTEVGDLLNSHLYLEFHQTAAQAKTIPTEKWHQLRKLVNARMPRFIEALNTFNYKPNLQETQIILLVKLRFLPSEIGALLCMTPYAISKKRTQLLKKMFGTEGPPDEFDRMILALGTDEIAVF